MDNLKKQYASYEDNDDIQVDCVNKLRFVYKNKDNENLAR
jgi:hypothetical protein